MGFGDPYHKHPLSPLFDPILGERADCFHCELPIGTRAFYGCHRCKFYIHNFCSNLPETMRHHLHHQHPLTLLTLLASSSDAPTPNLCNKCQEPCSEGFAYHCPTCQFILHVKCCFTLDHEKHRHPLIIDTHYKKDNPLLRVKVTTRNCNMCGYPINGFSFVCTGCNFFIHYDCSIIPPTIKHHHTHELAIRYDFPEECEQVYCDRCEDRDGELDRTLSYYYCKECDYIAHVPCVTQPKEDTMLFRRFIHERTSRFDLQDFQVYCDICKGKDGELDRTFSYNYCKKCDYTSDVPWFEESKMPGMLFKCFTHEHPLRFATKDLLCCNQCDYSVKTGSREYPSLIKHPRHPEHTLTYVEGDRLSKCTNCEFILDIYDAIRFVHPYTGDKHFWFCTDTCPFRCDVCGELGIGSRMKKEADFDLHLECFALPGKLEHESHPHHPLYLSSIPEDSLFACQYCNVCNKEIDQKVWIYCCLDCYYVAHLNCVAYDLLSTLRSSIKNEPGFCAIVEPDKKTFELHLAQIDPRFPTRKPKPLLRKLVKSQEDDDAKRSAVLVAEEVDGVVCCPNCNVQISIRAKDSRIKIGNQVSVATVKEMAF